MGAGVPPVQTGQTESEERHGFGRAFFSVSSVSSVVEIKSLSTGGKGYRREGYRRLISDATYPAPNPLSIFTTLTFDAHEFIIPKSAAKPLNAAP